MNLVLINGLNCVRWGCSCAHRGGSEHSHPNFPLDKFDLFHYMNGRTSPVEDANHVGFVEKMWWAQSQIDDRYVFVGLESLNVNLDSSGT